MAPFKGTPYQRVMARTVIEDRGHSTPCRICTMHVLPSGYVQVQTGAYPETRMRYVHRVVWEHEHGEIEDGMQIDHVCRQQACVEIAHLESVTPKVNNLRSTSPSSINARKTHCIRGHEFTPENTIAYRGWRRCRACREARKTKR